MQLVPSPCYNMGIQQQVTKYCGKEEKLILGVYSLELSDEAILMTTHNTHFHDKISNFLENNPQHLYS